MDFGPTHWEYSPDKVYIDIPRSSSFFSPGTLEKGDTTVYVQNLRCVVVQVFPATVSSPTLTLFSPFLLQT